MRNPKNKEERIIAALNSKVDDYFEYNGRIIIYGKNMNNENIYLGDIDIEHLYKKESNINAMIERIKFGWKNNKKLGA